MGAIRMKLLVTVTCLALLTGCTSAKISKALSSGAIGCPTSEIEISNETVTSGVHTFTATCKGVSYSCSYIHPAPIACKAQAK